MAGQHGLQIDCKAPSLPLAEYLYNEARFQMLRQSDRDEAARLLELAQGDVQARWQRYAQMAERQ